MSCKISAGLVVNTGDEKQLMTEKVYTHSTQTPENQPERRKHKKRAKKEMKKRSQKSVLWIKIQLRCLKQHLYWLSIKYRVDYQILLLDNYKSRLDVDAEQPVGKLTQF